jgi:hypothetical protein
MPSPVKKPIIYNGFMYHYIIHYKCTYNGFSKPLYLMVLDY